MEDCDGGLAGSSTGCRWPQCRDDFASLAQLEGRAGGPRGGEAQGLVQGSAVDGVKADGERAARIEQRIGVHRSGRGRGGDPRLRSN